MKYCTETTVMYADTDSYGVVWHGNYLRWFEQGRYSICKNAGVDVAELEKQGITFPVIDIHIRYKSPAKVFQNIFIETIISDVKSRTVTFAQCIKNKKSEATLVTAEVVCAVVNYSEAKLQKIPPEIFEAFKNAAE